MQILHVHEIGNISVVTQFNATEYIPFFSVQTIYFEFALRDLMLFSLFQVCFRNVKFIVLEFLYL